MSFVAGQKLRASQLQTMDDHLTVLDARMTGWGYRTTTSSGSTGSTVGALRIDNLVLTAGQVWEIRYRCHPDGTGNTVRTEVRFNTSGAAGTGDTVIVGTQAFDTVAGQREFAVNFAIGVSGTYSFLLTFARTAGASTSTLFCDTNRITEVEILPKGPASNTGVAV